MFCADERVAVSEPARHQVEELPPITVRVTEHRAQRLRCPGCGERTRAELEAEVAQSSFGPRLQAALTTLSVRNRVSRADAVELTEELFGARISSGSVEAILTRTAQALAKPHADLLQQLRGAQALNMDETGWRTAGQRRALWGMFDSEHAYFALASDRHEDRAKGCGRHRGDRDIRPLVGLYAPAATSPPALLGSFAAGLHGARRRARCRERVRRGRPRPLRARLLGLRGLSAHRRSLRTRSSPSAKLQRGYKPIIRRYTPKSARNKRCRGMAKNLLKAWPALWTFAAHTGVEPTNNHAERGLRSAVIYRKLSLGTQSEGGERRIERLLSAHTTCRRQRRSSFAYPTDAITTHAHGDPVPLLT